MERNVSPKSQTTIKYGMKMLSSREADIHKQILRFFFVTIDKGIAGDFQYQIGGPFRL